MCPVGVNFGVSGNFVPLTVSAYERDAEKALPWFEPFHVIICVCATFGFVGMQSREKSLKYKCRTVVIFNVCVGRPYQNDCDGSLQLS
jgi:hypothetical protein